MADSRGIIDALVRARGHAERAGSAAGEVALGGVALIGRLAQRALRSAAPEQHEAERPGSELSASERAEAGPTGPDFAAVDEDEARLMLRAMVAATVADGLVDAGERARLDAAVAAAGLDRDGRAWLERELADPADIDEIADAVDDAEAGARIYAAARLAVDLDTMQERQFLKMLAEALDVPPEATARLERELSA